MRRIDRYIGLLFLAAAIIAPGLVVAEAKAQEASVQVRVYDRDHRDYHNWDDREDRAYVTWWHTTGVIARTKGSTTECRDTIGIGATVTRTAINEDR